MSVYILILYYRLTTDRRVFAPSQNTVKNRANVQCETILKVPLHIRLQLIKIGDFSQNNNAPGEIYQRTIVLGD